jgi:hypothetical protein
MRECLAILHMINCVMSKVILFHWSILADAGCLGSLAVIPVGSLLALVITTAPHNRIRLQDALHRVGHYFLRYLCTGAFLYAPYSFLLISNKFSRGGGSAVMLLNRTEGVVGPYNLPKITRGLLYIKPRPASKAFRTGPYSSLVHK